ncbi:MAG: PAS domain-containing protein, partial [Myxococcales bacterium]
MAVELLHLAHNCDDTNAIASMLGAHGIVSAHETVDTIEDLDAALARRPRDVLVSAAFGIGFSAHDALAAAQRAEPSPPVVVLGDAVGEELAVDFILGGASDYVLRANLERIVGAVRRAQRQRRRGDSDKKFRSVVEHIPDGILMVEADGTVVEWNPAAAQITQVDQVDILGYPL